MCQKSHTHTHTVRDGSATVASGHTSGGTVGQWTRVGEGKMNQVAQQRLMISEGIDWGWGVGGCISFMSVSLTWGLNECVCVSVCVSMCLRGLLQLIIGLRCETPLPHPSHTNTHREPWDFPPLCQMMRADREKVGQTNNHHCKQPLYHNKERKKNKTQRHMH